MASFEWHGDEAAAAVQQAAVTGLNKAALALLAESQTRVPYDTGDLQGSGAVHEASAGNLESAVTYNAQNNGFNYGVAVHEGLGMSFQTAHNPGAQAKYLEGPAAEMKNELASVVQLQIRRALRS